MNRLTECVSYALMYEKKNLNHEWTHKCLLHFKVSNQKMTHAKNMLNQFIEIYKKKNWSAFRIFFYICRTIKGTTTGCINNWNNFAYSHSLSLVPNFMQYNANNSEYLVIFKCRLLSFDCRWPRVRVCVCVCV